MMDDGKYVIKRAKSAAPQVAGKLKKQSFIRKNTSEKISRQNFSIINGRRMIAGIVKPGHENLGCWV